MTPLTQAGAIPALYQEKIYAGVLGKIIGVYLGRPVEGWPYETIRERFGSIENYVNHSLGLPLIIADDDISGTFGFFRAVADSGYDKQLSAEAVGKSWLNYIIEEKTILWWGGLGNSTEHTAYLNLKAGIPAPRSGSIEQNGPTLSQQIGAQIFIDAYAMMCPGDPAAAAHYVRMAASVSHDGVALDAASYIGAMEALAFDVRDLDQLMQECEKYVFSRYLRKVIDDVRDICARTSDWREARAEIDQLYGYSKFSGPCHVVPNHSMVLASLIKGGDSFHRSVCIATNGAWDSDCNAATVGCLNAIRLGLDAINEEVDFRSPVADRMYVVTSDGGECVTDAVREARKVIVAAAALKDVPVVVSDEKFSFEFRGSVQGFMACPHVASTCDRIELANFNLKRPGENGLLVSLGALWEGRCANVSAPVFIDYEDLDAGYETIGSPLLYESQTVEAVLEDYGTSSPSVRFYAVFYDRANAKQFCYSDSYRLRPGSNTLTWRLPELGGVPISRLGFEFSSAVRPVSEVVIRSVDWSEPPERFEQRGPLAQDIWTLNPYAARQFVSSARHFTTSVNHAYTVSHPDENGVVTIGTGDFDNIAVSADLTFSLHRSGGLVARSRGHRRYYALVFSGLDRLSVVVRRDEVAQVLAEVEFPYQLDQRYEVSFIANEDRLSAMVDGNEVLTCRDPQATYTSGGCGFIVDSGTFYSHRFAVSRL